LATVGATLDEITGAAGQLSQPISKMIAQKRVLVVAACPKDQEVLRVGAEDRTIRSSLKSVIERGTVVVETLNAATTDDLRGALLKQDYYIVHFAGHADAFSLVFEDVQGGTVVSPLGALTELLKRYRVACVVLNGCYSLAAHTAPLASVTVGMTDSIDDDAAVEFARGFYDAIAASKGYEFAAAEGKSAADLKGLTVPLKIQK